MDTVLPVCSGSLTGDKQTQLNNNLEAIPPSAVTSGGEIRAAERQGSVLIVEDTRSALVDLRQNSSLSTTHPAQI